MILLELPSGVKDKRLPFFLAMEEWAAKTLPDTDYFFTWRVKPTVICGRNQDIDVEVDLDYCRKHGIDVVRRKSGGGCVYADSDNLMISYITPHTDVESTFSQYTDTVARLLSDFDIPASVTGRNDLTISGKKISGNAYYLLQGHSIVHGTLLFSTNMEHMLNAITPSRAKLLSKNVTSVERRITTIKELVPFVTIETFVNYIQYVLGDEKRKLTMEDVAIIDDMAAEYYQPQWLKEGGHMPADSNCRHCQKEFSIQGVGNFHICLNMSQTHILSMELNGDFFNIGDIDPLIDLMQGLPYDAEAVSNALASVDLPAIIPGMDSSLLASMIMQTAALS